MPIFKVTFALKISGSILILPLNFFNELKKYVCKLSLSSTSKKYKTFILKGKKTLVKTK